MRANPLLPGFHPDPSMCRVGDDFYLVTSTFEYFPGLPIYHSRDLSNWTLIGHAIHDRDQVDFEGVKGSGGMFAPTLRYHEGTFFLACTLMHGLGRRGSFVITASDPAGPWSEPAWLDDAPGIDPSLFFDDNGTCWYTGCELNPVPGAPEQTDIWLQRFDPAAARFVGERTVISHGVLRGARWAEGPHLYRVDGEYVLVHAEGGTERAHAVMVSKASAVTGPYVPHAANPVLTHRHLGRSEPVYGVGHADLFDDADGRWWAVALAMQTYDGAHHVRGRETVIVPVEWEDGWPVFAPGAGRVPALVELPALAQDSPWRGHAHIDAHEGPDGSWVQLRTGAPFWGHGPSGLTLRATGSALTDRSTPAFLCHRLLTEAARIEVRIAETAPAPATTGLALYQSERFHIVAGVRRAGAECSLVVETVADGQTVETLTASARPSDAVTVTVDIDRSSATARVVAGDTVVEAPLDLTVLSTERAGGFVGTMLGPVIVADEEGPAALFTRVSIEPR